MQAAQEKPFGSPIWADLGSASPEHSAAFYTRLLGWTVTDPVAEMGGYQSFLADSGIMAGLFPPMPPSPTGWVIHFKVADADAALATALTLGGTLIAGPHVIGDLGVTVVVKDPSGVTFGLWQPGTHTGFSAENVPGAPSWFELHTADYAGALTFYSELFGWPLTSIGDSDEFRMSVAGDPSMPVAGIYDTTSGHPESTPPRWELYLTVVDADAAAVTTRERGGTVLDGPADTPFGRMSHALDSEGSAFTFIQLPVAAPEEAS